MKNLSKLLLLILLVYGYSNMSAQDKMNPWQITIGMNAVDEYPSGDGGVFSQGIFDEYANIKDHWNIIPSMSMLSISKYLDKGISFGLTGSLNQIKQRGTKTLATELTYYSIDGTFKYNFLEAGKTFDPFIGLGGGYTFIEQVPGSNEKGDGPTANGALGFNVWVNQTLGFTIQSAYKHSFGDAKSENDLNTLFQHSIGLSLKFGGVDTDGDGILDKKDACPDLPGVEAFKGCPDTDGDGIKDSEDDCPDVSGLPEFNGCPDSDGDGIVDNEDKCPEVAGLKELDGCLDTDGDGVTDGEDECGDVAGPKENKGCPWKDTDGDSVLDKDDKCPEVKGDVANEGCPELTEAVIKTLSEYNKTILFDSGTANIKKQSAQVLADIIKILKEYKAAKFTIEGHTDNTYDDTYNEKLSINRANAVKQYLVDHGIDEVRLSASGYGESKPIATNRTEAGRAKNRRVEINLAN